MQSRRSFFVFNPAREQIHEGHEGFEEISRRSRGSRRIVHAGIGRAIHLVQRRLGGARRLFKPLWLESPLDCIQLRELKRSHRERDKDSIVTGASQAIGAGVVHTDSVVQLSVEIAAENIEDLNQRTVADRIVDRVARLPADHDLFGSENW